MINICSDIKSEKIADKVNRAKIFSVIADEITYVFKNRTDVSVTFYENLLSDYSTVFNVEFPMWKLKWLNDNF